MKSLLLATGLALITATSAAASQTVVLLHGLARTPGSLAKMERKLKEAGYTTCNIGYPSTRHPIETLAKDFVIPRIEACLGETSGGVSFVTHSLGGIMVREIRRLAPNLPVARVVMLGPPNHGSELVDHMRSWTLFKWVNGPAGQQLGTEPGSVPNRLGPPDFELGVIAGNKPFLEPFKSYIPGPGDGKVSVESAKMEGMSDFRVLPVGHTFMMRDPEVIRLTLGFLDSGKFP